MTSVKVFGLVFICFFGLIASESAPANTLDDEELAELLSQYYEAPVEAKRNPVYQAYRKHFVPGKRGGSLPNLGIYRRPTVNDYLKLAAIEQELENAAAAEGVEPVEGEPALEPEAAHSVDKRRSRYGFWVTAINKMDNNHLKGFLGQHKNVYNVYKRSVDADYMKAKKGTPFVPNMGNSAN